MTHYHIWKRGENQGVVMTLASDTPTGLPGRNVYTIETRDEAERLAAEATRIMDGREHVVIECDAPSGGNHTAAGVRWEQAQA